MLYFDGMTTIEQLNARGQGYLPGLIGIEFSSVEPVSDVSFPDAIPSTVELLEQIEALEAGE